MSSKMASYCYVEVRRHLKDRTNRAIVLVLLLIIIILSLGPSTSSDISASDKPPKLWTPTAFGNSAGVTAIPKVYDEVVDPLRPRSAVGKVHAVFGEPNPVYERALKLHKAHADQQGHPMFVLRERILSGLWSKPAFILSTMLQELAKPEESRLQWLLWIDADIVVMNPKIPLDIFIPPAPEFSYVNMLATNDRHGLNNGCFLIRINPWAVKLLSAVIAFHTFKPKVKLQYSEQSALEEMIEDSYWRKSVVHVPQYWFNAYPAKNADETNPKAHEYRAGGLQIHFAGNRDGKRPERMDTWMSIAEQDVAPYNATLADSGLVEDIQEFWTHLSEERTKKGIKPIGNEN